MDPDPLHFYLKWRVSILWTGFVWNKSKVWSMPRKLKSNWLNHLTQQVQLGLAIKVNSSLCLLATQKNKKLSLSLDLSLPKIQKLSHTIAQSPWLQLAVTASHTSTTSGVLVHSCLFPSAAGGAIVGATTSSGCRVLLSFSLLSFLFYFSFCFSFYLPFRSDWIP